MADDESAKRQITLTLAGRYVDVLDRLKQEFGVRSRGKVLETLLEDLVCSADAEEATTAPGLNDPPTDDDSPDTSDASSLVLIGRTADSNDLQEPAVPSAESPAVTASTGIDLPGFVRRRTTQLKESLSDPPPSGRPQADPLLSPVSHDDLIGAGRAAEDHWRSLYGQDPGETVVEAAMLWLGRDLWPSVDASDGRPFTWTAANAAIQELCPEWNLAEPSLGRVMVVAGALEDPFATAFLADRMPTLVRRFVNRFRRSRQVTSFETLESTMTVHGALKLLGLSTQAGASVTLNSIREAYKGRALDEHPDAGGSTESMRRLNEAYRLLRELYRQR